MNTIHIKTSVLSVIIFVFTIFAWESGEAQCNNCATDGLITPTGSNPVFAPAWTTVNVNTIKGNQFMLFNVVKGQIYRWSTAGAEDTVPGVPGINCTTDAQCSGGYLCVGTEGAKKCAVPCNTNAECQTINSGLRCIGATGTKRCEIGFDTELTVLKDACGSSGVVLAYNRNATLMNQSEVEYKADFTGTVYVLVTNYQCSSSCDQFGGNCMTTSLKWQRIDSTFCEDCKNNSGMIVFKETAESLMKYGLFSYGPSTGTEYEATMYRGPVKVTIGDTSSFSEYSALTYGATTGLENIGYLTQKDSTSLNIIQHGAKLAAGNKIKQGASSATVSAIDSDSKRNISMLYYTVPIATGDKIKQGGESGTVASIVKGGVNTPDTSTWAHTSYDFQKAGDYQIFNVVKGRIYRWTTCTDQSYDTQMTLYRGQAGKKCSLSGFACTKDSDCGTSETCDSYCGQQFLAYSDDTAESPCSSTNNKQTILEWKSDFGTVTTPGKVTLLVNQYNCGFCYQSPDYYNPWTHCPKTTVMMQRYDCYSCGTQKGSTNDFSDTVKTESSLVPGNYMKFNVKKGEKYRFKSTQQETGSTFSAILTLRKDNSTACAGETLAQSKLQDGSTYVQVIDFAAKEDMVVELLVSRSDVACSTTAYGKTATVTYEKLTSTYMTFEDNFVDDNGDQWTNVTRTSDGMIIYDQNKYMYTWEEAMEYCENLVYTIPSTSTDVEDWVLPNITELYSIVDFDLYDKATSFRLPSYVTVDPPVKACTLDTQETDCGYPQYICGDELKCVRNNWYWTSTSVADSASFSWGINMKDGRSYRVLKSDIGVLVPATAHKVVCIRGDSVSGEFDPIRPAAERKFSGWACDKDKPDENVDIYFVIRKEVDDSGNGSNILNIGNYHIRGGSRIPNTFPTIYGFKYGETNKYPDETTKTAADKAVMTTKINSNCNNTATTVKHAFELDLSSSSGLAKTIKNAIDNEHADPVYSVTAYAGNGEKHPHKLRFKRLLFEKERFVLVDECGDGLISIGETCDDKNTVTEECAYNTPCNVCDSTCQWALGFVPKCRDGVVDALYEDCDCGSSSTYWIYDCSQTLPEKKCPGYGSGTCTICNEICSEEILNVPYCGDGTKDIHPDSTEECDDGNTIDNDGCVTGCKLPFCGDGFIFNTGPGANETCDDGSLNGAYANQCTPGPCCNETCDGDGPVCGDGILHRDDCPGAINYGDAGVWNTKPCIKIFGAAETCDAGADNGVWRDLAGHVTDPGCNSTCSGEAPYCGDGDLQSVYELCDDGTDNQNDTYGKCRTDCSAKPRCGDGKWDGFGGDGLVTGPENCDDGIYNGSYGYCNNTCSGKVECGDQELDPAYEECEHKGNPQSYDPDIAFACNPDCTMGRYCGDGFLDNSRNVPLNNWTDPAAWSSHAGMTWDSNLEALKVVGYHETVLNVPVPIDTSKQYYMEYDVMTKNNSGKVLYSGTISYDSAMTQLSGHPGSYDYFVDSAITFTADTWYHRRNTFIGGLPRTGESANTNDRHMWHPGTAYAKVMFLFNYDGSSTQETYIKNLKFYTIEDGVTGLGDNELCDHGSANVEKDFATGYMVDCIATPTKNASGIYVYDKAYSCKWAHYCGDGLVDGPGGDGLVTGPEVCDDGALGNIGEYNKCNPGCLELGPRCGDGIVNGTEECDNNGTNSDAPGEPGVTCRTNCKWAKCGDNIQDTGEECDNGTANSNTTPNACRTNCTVSKCGDGVKDSTEECDDGDLNVTGIVAQYTFNETSSTIADDTSGNGYNGTIVGAHRYNIGRFGRAMEFDAVNDYVQIPNPLSSQPNLSQEWTVSAWVNIKNTGADQFLISGMNLGVKLVHGAGDRMLLYVNSGTNDYYVYSNSAGLLTGQGWKHVVFVFRNSDGYRRIYVDGADKTGTGPNNTSTPSGISGTLRIGNLVNGLIDHVQIYNRAITPDEVTALYYLYGDSCNNCKNAKCGDGYRKIKDSTTGQFTAGILNEVCDDANVSNDDYCRNDCQAIIGFCGDGNIQNGSPASEECDSLGNPYCTGPCTGTGATMVCKPGCTLNHGNCGDGTRNYIAGEECDNGTNNDDLEGYCDTTCKVAGSCGDGEIQSKDESCDSAASTVAPGEGVGAYCINDCQTLLGNCGDGRIQGPGYTTSYYGGTLPTTPALWTTDGPEYCDTNDPRTISLTNTTGCNATTCTRDGSCGDGIRQSRFEGCDGSVTAGDSRLVLRLDEKTGSTAVDDSGNGNNGTVYYWKENRVTYSQDFSNGIWNSYCGNRTNFTYNIFAPDMTNTAVKIVMPNPLGCDSTFGGRGVLQTVAPALVAGGTYTVSVWLKGESGGESVGIGLNDGHMTTVTLTNEWKRYTATFTGITNITRGLQFRGAVAGQTYYAWGAQLQNRSKMSAYAETTSAPIAGSTSVYDGFGMWAKGKMGNALLFDGSKDYVVVPNNASMNPTSITVSMWLYLNQNPSCDANNNWRSVIRKGSTSGTTTGFDVVLEQSRVLVWDTGSGSSDRWNLGAAGTLPLNSWTHVVLVYDQTGSKKAYMNGNLIGTKSIAAAPLASNTSSLYISNSSSDCPNGAGAFPGFIDDVRIYSGALTPDQISKSIYDISQTCRAGCKSDPVGNLETALRTEISGWACDPDWPMRQARVVLEFTDRFGTRAYVTTPNDIMFTTFLSSEQSIQNICGGGANHRWSFNPALVNWTGLFQPFTVKAWALTEDVSPETDTLLGTKTFTMGPVCRDGVLEGDEECDDGNDVWADTCRNDCKVPKCEDTYDHDNNPATAEIPLVSSTETCEVGTTTSCVSAGVTGGTGTVTCKTDCSAWNTVPTGCSALNDTTKALCACQKSWTCPTKPWWNNELDTDYNTVDTYTQYWVGAGAWDPANDTLTDYDDTPSSTSCRFLCGLNLEWDSGLGKCVGIEKTPDFNCASYLDTSVPAHAGKVINTPSTYTQTWTFDGGNWDWYPEDDTTVDYSSTYVGPTNPCTYRCNTGYTHYNGTCYENTKTYTCPTTKPANSIWWNSDGSYTQTYIGSGNYSPAATSPTYSEIPSATSCVFKCAPGYQWNGTNSCVKQLCPDGSLMDKGYLFDPNEKLLLYMNENTGSTAYDSSPNNNKGTVLNATWTTGKFQSGLNFNGTNAYVTLGNPATLQITGSQTISMWVKPTDFAVRRNPYNKAYGGEGTITIETDGTVNYYYGTKGGNDVPYQGFNTASSLTAGEWNHIAIVRDLGAMQLRWYINGVLTNTAAASYAAAAVSSNNVTIGYGYAGYFKGQIDHVRVVARALNATEVKQSMGELCDTFEGRANSDTWVAQKTCNTTCDGWAPYCGDAVEQSANELCDYNNPSGYTKTQLCTKKHPGYSSFYTDFSDPSCNTSCGVSGNCYFCGDGSMTATTDLKMFLKMEDNYDDTTTNNNHASGSSGGGFTTGTASDRAASFSYSGLYVPDSLSTNLGAASTIEFWMKTSQTIFADPPVPILFKGIHSGIIDYAAWLEPAKGGNPAGHVSFVFYTGSTTGCGVHSSTIVNDNVWHHVVATLGGNYMKIYVDGVYQAQEYCTLTPLASGEPLRIGWSNIAGYPYFSGQLDEIKLYNRTLSSSEIYVNKLERCDAGSSNGACNSTCSSTCTVKTPDPCGNGVFCAATEQCDLGASNGNCSTCTTSCTTKPANYCGDSYICGSEICDGNTKACSSLTLGGATPTSGTATCNSCTSWNTAGICGKTYSCSGAPTNTVYYNGSTSYSYSQTWNGSAWSPANSAASYAASPAVNTCQYKCASTHMWNGSSCVLAGENCDVAQNLGSTSGTFTGTTVGYANDIGTCKTGAPDRVFYLDVPANYQITVKETANNYDEYEYIGYGNTCPGGTQIQCWDNDSLNATEWHNTTGSTQRVWYIQDGYGSKSGTFTLSWNMYHNNTFLVPNSGSTDITTSDGYLKDHAGDSNYSNSANGYTIIRPATAGKKIRLTFTSFSVETCCDKVYIYEGAGIGGTLIGTYTSSPGTVSSTTGVLTVKFTSDYSVVYSGFQATISEY